MNYIIEEKRSWSSVVLCCCRYNNNKGVMGRREWKPKWLVQQMFPGFFTLQSRMPNFLYDKSKYDGYDFNINKDNSDVEMTTIL